MENFILFLNNLEGLKLIRPNLIDLEKTINLMNDYKLDFDDALIVSVMLSNNIKELISFDKDFDKVKEIKRMEPKE